MTMKMGPIVLRPTWFARCTYMCDKCHKETSTVVGVDYVGFLCNECMKTLQSEGSGT